MIDIGIPAGTKNNKNVKMLSKVGKNKDASSVDEREEKNLAKYQGIVDE